MKSQHDSEKDILQFDQMIRALTFELLSRRLHMLPESIITTLSVCTLIHYYKTHLYTNNFSSILHRY